MGIISIAVTGIDEAVSGLDAATRMLPQTRRRILQQASNFMANELRRNVHVVSGMLRASISVKSPSDRQGVVSVSAPYAVYENRRPGVKPGVGPHNFADMAQIATINALPGIVDANMADLFRTTIKKPYKYTHKTIGKSGRTIYHYSLTSRMKSTFRPRMSPVPD